MKKIVLTILSVMILVCSFESVSQALYLSPSTITLVNRQYTLINNTPPDFRVKSVEVCNNVVPQTTEVKVTVENIGGNKGVTGNILNYVQVYPYKLVAISAAPYNGNPVTFSTPYNNKYGKPIYVDIGVNQFTQVYETYIQNNVSKFVPPCNWYGCLEDPNVTDYNGCRPWVKFN